MKEWLWQRFPELHSWTATWRDLEFGREDKSVWLMGFLAVLLLASWVYRRDAAELRGFWKVWLLGLRLLTLLVVLWIALLPQERRSRTQAHPSRVVFLVDRSLSMTFPAADPQESGNKDTGPSRADAVRKLLASSPLLPKLRGTHDLRVYTFDSKLSDQPVALLERFPDAQSSPATPGGGGAGTGSAAGTASTGGTNPPGGPGQTPKSPPVIPDSTWEEWLRPQGLETRLGEALTEVLRREADETLAGVVILSDGANNAGADVTAAADAAVALKTPLFPVGVGGVRRQADVRLSEIQAPTHVHLGDGFTLTALVVGSGLPGQTVTVELQTQMDGDDEKPTALESRDIQLIEDGVPVSVAFDYVPRDVGRRKFLVRVSPTRALVEFDERNNLGSATVEVVDRKTRVLLVAGGPMRDYQFVRNLLHRDKSISVDVLLQTGQVGISQESDNLLSAFPSTREELFAYDVIVAFDPDWKAIRGDTGESFQLLAEWVEQQAGGLVLIAGEVYTPQVAAAGRDAGPDWEPLLRLYPVVLDSHPFEAEDDALQPWPVDLTREGQEAGFLQLAETPAASAAVWRDFGGVYRCYPTSAAKAGATIYARFTDPRAGIGDERPILLASQLYGGGHVLYLGTAEMWLLRALNEDDYDRFWIKLIRDAGQGRLLRGTNRALLLIDSKTHTLGSTVQVHARILDAQFKDWSAERAPLEVFDPQGRGVLPPVELIAQKTRPGYYSGAFPTLSPGTYRLELPIPDSKDVVRETVQVKLPDLEFDHPEQNVQNLRVLAREIDSPGRYLTLSDAADRLPALLPDRSLLKTQFDLPRPLWDNQWTMLALVGLLSTEWLTRKLLKLA